MSLQYYTPNLSKKLFFSSDFHGYHRNICSGESVWPEKKGCRDFLTAVEMTNFIVTQVNNTIGKDDILYFLGDWSFGGKDNVKKLRDLIRCETIICVLGNHDHHIRNDSNLQSYFTKVSHYEEFYYKKTLYTCSHYPIGSWHEIGKGAINTHAHSHGNYSRALPRQIDVGLDAQGMQIRSIEWIHQYMLDKPIVNVDHHNATS